MGNASLVKLLQASVGDSVKRRADSADVRATARAANAKFEACMVARGIPRADAREYMRQVSQSAI
jgi:hypothetical protein